MKSENYQIKMSKKYSYSTKKIITIAEHKIEEKNKPTKKKILVQNFKVPLLLLTMVPLKSKHIIPLLTTSLHCNFCTFPKQGRRSDLKSEGAQGGIFFSCNFLLRFWAIWENDLFSKSQKVRGLKPPLPPLVRRPW